MNFHVEPISGMDFHVRPDLQNEKMKKQRKKLKKKIFFVVFFFFFILKVHFFWSPKKVHSEILPTSKVHFFHSGKMFEAKVCFLFISLFQNFKFKYPIPNPP